MGTPVPVISGREAAKAFKRLGWMLLRQRGSHMIFGKSDVPANLAIPDHKELARGTLRSLIRTSGTTVEEFVAALQ